MDGVFALPEAARADFLRSLLQSFGCTYVSLWQYDSNLSNRLFFLDGFYDVTNNLENHEAERLFHQYRALTFDVNHHCVPGIAFRNHLPYMELQQMDLLRLASTQIQTQFFQEARIQLAVFMGCRKGEIELGFSNMTSQVDIQTALKNLFSEDFYIRSQSTTDPQNSHSSSSSFVSLSTGSTSQSHLPETQTSPHQPLDLAPVIPSYFFTPEGEHEAIVGAILHVLSTPSSTPDQQHQPHQNFPNYASITRPEDTVLNRSDINPNITVLPSNFHSQSLHNRSFAFFGNLNLTRMRGSNQASRPISTTQQHHMITERRRREKLNENFQALRALLPPGTKKNKVSILTTAKETLRCLMDEIEKLNMRNQQLMTVLSGKEEATAITSEENDQRLNVGVSRVSESSSSEEQVVELQVTVRGESSQADVLIRLLEFLGGVQNVSLISTGANNHQITGGTVINQLTFRLRISEGSEWDERAFQEAVRRVVADVLQCQLNQ